MAKKLKYAVAVWYDLETTEFYGFPVGAKDPWGGTVVPQINLRTWEFKGVLPAGLEVSGVKHENGNRVKGEVANVSLVTGDWVLLDD